MVYVTLQALTNIDNLNSKPSDPLVVTWPGVQPPVLQRVPAVSNNAIKVAWDPPLVTEGVKIKVFKVCNMKFTVTSLHLELFQ